jgi:TetR/AcrR family transcriptional regulator, mexJK operon transcriptional repressor
MIGRDAMKQKLEQDGKSKPARRVPRGDVRRMELAGVAEQVFLERGFASTTMQMIASRAGGSKETLYRHFASKEALFAEIIGRKAARISGPESALARDGTPEQVLFELGHSLLMMMTRSDTSSLFSVVVAEAPRSPELAAIFYAHGPGITLQRLTDYLRTATRRGDLHCHQPSRAAKLFLGAVVAQHHLQSLIGQPPMPVPDAEIREHVRAAIAMFLARYGARPEGDRSRLADSSD